MQVQNKSGQKVAYSVKKGAPFPPCPPQMEDDLRQGELDHWETHTFELPTGTDYFVGFYEADEERRCLIISQSGRVFNQEIVLRQSSGRLVVDDVTIHFG